MELFKRKNNKKNTTPVELDPIDLPVLNYKSSSPADILSLLIDGNTIWAWFKVDHIINGQLNFTAMMNMSYGFEGLAVYKKVNNYLYKYNVDVDKEGIIYLKISEISRFINSNIMELFNTDMHDAYKLFYDHNSDFFDHTMCYITDITEELIERKLEDNRVFKIDESHFYKKSDYSDGLPSIN